MKKILALALAVLMVVSLAACGSNAKTTEPSTTAPTVTGPASALELLQTVWTAYPEEAKFPTMGGDVTAPTTDGNPGAVNLDVAEENPLYILNFPGDQLANISEAATVFHAMNTNTFAAGVVKVAEGADVKTVAQAIRDAVMSTHWMCGFPERMIVASVGDYIVMSFGLDGVSDPESVKIMSTFLQSLKTSYANTEVLFDEEIL